MRPSGTDGSPSYGGLGPLGYRDTACTMSTLPNPVHFYPPAIHSVSANAKRRLLDALNCTPSAKHLDYHL